MTLAASIAQSGANNVTMRNRIINGAMMIDQRNAGASVAVTGNTGQMAVDRFELTVFGSGTGRFSGQRSTTAPAGFINSLQITVTTADASPSSAYAYAVGQTFEGYNVADLGWGTANAQAATLSFWVRSSVTGTFPMVVNPAALDRSYGATYTINSSNTWEYKTITIPGPTTGTFATDNTGSFNVKFGLGGGSGRTIAAGSWVTTNAGSTQTNVTGATQLIATNGATFYITGVQLEKGTTATAFEQRLYGTELALCQRYYWKNQAQNAFAGFGTGVMYSSTAAQSVIKYPVDMRSTPSFSFSSLRVQNATSTATVSAVNTAYQATNTSQVEFTVGSGLSAGTAFWVGANNTTAAYLDASAEL